MLTEVTANMRERSIQDTSPLKRVIPVALSFYRRLDETALHCAKRTRDGMPTLGAVLERVWFEVHSEPGFLGWECSFANVCQMLGWNEAETRVQRLAEIDRAWRHALTDYGCKRRNRMIAEILAMEAPNNPLWVRRHFVQEDLPMPEHGTPDPEAA